MAAPTITEVLQMGTNVLDCLESARSHFDTVHAVAGGTIDALQQDLEGDVAAPALAAWSGSFRSLLSGVISRRVARAALLPIYREIGNLANAPEQSNVDALVQRVYDYFMDGTRTVKTRAITFDTPAAGGSNAGNGTLTRLTVDERNQNIESVNVELKTVECIVDHNSGAQKGEEIFEFRGVDTTPDYLLLSGSGEAGMLTAFCRHEGSGAAGSLLRNSSFDAFSNGGTTTDFSGWTMDAAGRYDNDTTNYYRVAPGASASSSGSLKMDANGSISQSLYTTRTPIRPGVPYCLQIAYNRQVGSGDGTLTIRMGAHNTNVVLAAQTGWNILRVTLNTNCWFRNFNEQDLDVSIELSGRTTGYVLVDAVIFAPLIQFDSTWWWLVGGATPFLKRDVFTATDTGGAAGTGIVQYWLWRAGLGYLPSTAGAPTWVEPT